MARTVEFNFFGRIPDEKEISDREIEELNGKSHFIAGEIEEDIQSKIAEAYYHRPAVRFVPGIFRRRPTFRANVVISFDKGSIEWMGIVELVTGAWSIVNFMATIGGAIGLIHIVRRAILAAVGRSMPSHIQMSNATTHVSIGRSRATAPLYIRPQDDFSNFTISAKKVLVAVTALNIGLVGGGTLYGGIKVASLQDQYASTSNKIQAIVDEAKSAEAELALAERFVASQLDSVTTKANQTIKEMDHALLNVQSATNEAITSVNEQSTTVKSQFEHLVQDARLELANVADHGDKIQADLDVELATHLTKLRDRTQVSLNQITDQKTELLQSLEQIEDSVRLAQSSIGANEKHLESTRNKIVALDDELEMESKRLSDAVQRIDDWNNVTKLTLSDLWSRSSDALRALLIIMGLFLVLLFSLTMWSLVDSRRHGESQP